MAAPIVTETPSSRALAKQYAGGGGTLEFCVLYQDFVGLYALLDAQTPAQFEGFDRKSYRPRSLGAPDCWLVEVEYGSQAPAGSWRPDQFSGRVTSTTAHITQSLQTLNRLRPADFDLAGTNMQVDATTNTNVLPDGWSPATNDIGWVIAIVGSGAWGAGNYTITGIVPATETTPAKWILNRSPAPAGTLGGRWSKGVTAPGGTNLTVDAGADTQVTPDNYTPNAGDVNRQIWIVDGDDFSAGLYTITAIAGGEWVLDQSPAAAGTDGGVWFMIGTAPDYQGAIGVSLDTVQGCDVRVPLSELVFSSSLDEMNAAYVIASRALVGCTNDDTFLGFPSGTLLYLGWEPTSPEGSLPATGAAVLFWNLAHSFLYEPAVINTTIGGVTVAVKPPHSYVWCRYQAMALNNTLVQTPSAVYVEQVANAGDFTVLGISL